MFDLDFILTAVLALGVTTVSVLGAPTGYEDEAGFHFDDDWLNS